jgi:hypothetical protein
MSVMKAKQLSGIGLQTALPLLEYAQEISTPNKMFVILFYVIGTEIWI